MSLQVWLPLNGDLHNQGLGNITVTSGTSNFKTNGKIGSCFDLNTRINFTCPQLVNIQTFSIAFWVKVNADTSLSANWVDVIGFTDATSSGTTGQLRWETCYGSGYKTRGISSHDNTTNAISNSFGAILGAEKGKWYHIACTVDIVNNEIKEYSNGVLVRTIVPNGGHLTGVFWIGQANVVNGELNDVRIYDHALSAKEVEEIAKGLVLHYKLDNNGLGGENLFRETSMINKNNFVANNSTDWTKYFRYYNGSAAIHTLSNNEDTVTLNTSGNLGIAFTRKATDINLDANSYYTISCEAKCTKSGAGLDIGLSYYNNSNSWVWCGGTNRQLFTSVNTWQKFTLKFKPDSNTQYICYCFTVVGTSGGTDTFTIRHCKLEKGEIATRWSPAPADLGLDTSIVYDSSGYGNNGTIVGSLTTSTPSPRYDCATKFDGNTSCIKILYNEINPDRIFTVNLWFHKDALGSKNYETLFGGPSGFEMDTRAGASTTLSLYMASVRGGNAFSPFNLNEWYMVTMVRNGTNEMYYINGELKKTIEAKSMPSGQYRIGAWASDTGQNYYGDMSDFRIYATALTPEQIKELYNTSMSIDNNGNIHVRELVEL